MTIKFLKDSNGYDSGDVVEMADELAKQLIATGAAAEYQSPTPPTKAEKSPAKK